MPGSEKIRQRWERHLREGNGVRAAVPQLLIGAGLCTLLYVGTQYLMMFNSQRQLQRQWDMQNAPIATIAAQDSPVPGNLVRITIPRINLDAIVVEGTTTKALMRGPGHSLSSAYPGEAGNVVITGHRDTFFRHIYELSKGDLIQLQRGGTAYTYEVTGKKVTNPNDLSVVQQTPDARLTLITCYPTYYIGPAPERLVVFSRLISPSATGTAAIKPVASPQP